MKFAIQKIEESLRNVITEYESLCEKNRAQSAEAKELFKVRHDLFKALGIPECSHNAAIYGSKRYAKCKEINFDRAITFQEFKNIHEEKSRD